MVDAARQAKLSYIVNVVIDKDKRVVAAFAGDPFEAYKAGTEFLAGQCRVKAVPPASSSRAMEMRETIEEMKMKYAASLDEALAMAREIVGEEAKVTVIPNGISVIVAE